MQVCLEAMNSFSCSLPSSTCSSSTFQPFVRSLRVPAAVRSRCRRTTALARRSPGNIVLAASKRDDAYGADSGRWQIDEDMIVLRKRLHGMRAAEMNYEPPSHWMEWEKRYYASYDADVCRFVGMLQAFLMNTRPGVALGLLALAALSVPASAGVVVFKLVEVTKVVLAGVHLG